MFKKQQKWIALFVAVTFIWLMQISTMPMAAASSTAKITSASTEPGPSFIEEAGGNPARGKKKSVLPWILIGVGVITITAVVLFLFVLNKYDIRGDWNVSRTANGSTYTFTVKFIGEKTGGSFDAQQSGNLLHGTYSADGKTVVWTFESGSKYSGAFTDKDAMSGDYLKYDGVTTGTWTATRIPAAASTSNPAQTNTKQDSDISPQH